MAAKRTPRWKDNDKSEQLIDVANRCGIRFVLPFEAVCEVIGGDIEDTVRIRLNHLSKLVEKLKPPHLG